MAAGLYLGSSQIKNVYLGGTKADKVYLGSSQVWANATTVTASPSVSADDGGTLGTSTLTVNNGIMLASGSATNNGFCRFVGVDIPQGATIQSAAFSFTYSGTNTANATIYAIASDNTSSPSSATDIRSATLTTASASWTTAISSGTNTSPDISTVIQEIVNRSGWASGNALTIVAKMSGTAPSNIFASDLSETLTVIYS